MTRRERVYRFIVDYKREHDGVAPSVREIRNSVGLASTSTVIRHLRMLEKAGRIILNNYGASRSIQIPGALWLAPGEHE